MIFLAQCSILKLFPIRIDLILPPQNRSFHNPQPSETSKVLHLPKVYPNQINPINPSHPTMPRGYESFTCLGPCGQRGLLCPHGPKQVRKPDLGRPGQRTTGLTFGGGGSNEKCAWSLIGSDCQTRKAWYFLNSPKWWIPRRPWIVANFVRRDSNHVAKSSSLYNKCMGWTHHQ